jgi:hypothetical protein
VLTVQSGGDTSVAEVIGGDGAVVTPTGGTYVLRDHGRTIKAQGSVVVVGTEAQSPTIDTTLLDPGEGWREEWAITTATGTVRQEREAIVCRYALSCPIGARDITETLPQLGSGTSALAADLVIDDYIDEAWVRIQARLIERGRRPWLSISPYALREVTLELAISLAYQRLAARNTQWTEAAENHRRAYERAWKALRLTYVDPDGDRDGPRRPARRGAVWLGSGE